MDGFDIREAAAHQRGFLLFMFVQAVVAFVCFAAVVGLRFVRRGATRFWIGPALVALCLLPGVVGAGITVLAFRDVIGATAIVGSGSASALAAGAMESLIPLLVGLFSVGGLSLFALLSVAAGTSRVDEAAPSGGATWAPFLAPLAILLGFGPLFAATALVNHGGVGALQTERMIRWWWLAAAVTVAAGVALVAFAVWTALRAPRTRAPLVAKLLPPLSLAAAALGAAVFCIATFSSMARLSAHAIKEAPVVAGVEEPTPEEPATEEPSPEPSAEPELEAEPTAEPPPVTEPTPRPTRARPVATRAAREPEVPRAVRVGGTIAEPRKLKNVSPFYPAIAKQARVQGVVILECTIGVDGRVTDVKVLRSIPLLDDAAVEAVRQWVYTPTLLNGAPVQVIMTVTVNFKLS